MTDLDFANAKIRGLERELREARETFEDRVALAALTGTIGAPEIPDTPPQAIAEAAYRLAAEAWMVRSKLNRTRIDAAIKLAQDLLDPDMFGHAVNGEIRDRARFVIGLPRVES